MFSSNLQLELNRLLEILVLLSSVCLIISGEKIFRFLNYLVLVLIECKNDFFYDIVLLI